MYAARDDVVILLLLLLLLLLLYYALLLRFLSRGASRGRSVVRLRLRLRKSHRSSATTTAKKPSFICDYDCEKAKVNFSKLLQCFFQDSEGTDTGTAWGGSSFLEEGAGGQALGWKELELWKELPLLSASALQWPTLLVKATMIIAGPSIQGGRIKWQQQCHQGQG